MHNYCFFQNAKTIACVFVMFLFSFRVISLHFYFLSWGCCCCCFCCSIFFIRIFISHITFPLSIREKKTRIAYYSLLCDVFFSSLFWMHLNKYHQNDNADWLKKHNKSLKILNTRIIVISELMKRQIQYAKP